MLDGRTLITQLERLMQPIDASKLKAVDVDDFPKSVSHRVVEFMI